MSTDAKDDIILERMATDEFGVRADVKQVITSRLPVSRTGVATVFLTSKKQLFAYIDGQNSMTLSDVQKIITRMGLKAELFVPPKHQPDFFDDVGREKFKEVFPGRARVTEDDIRFYRTLAPYKPALVLLSGVRDGHIYGYDADTSGQWRPAVKFAYRRIKTS